MTTNTDKLAQRVEAVARAICIARELEPDTLYQILGSDEGQYPIDKTDSHGRQFYWAWRKWTKSAGAAIAALSSPPAQSDSDHETRTALMIDAIIRDIAELPDRTSPEGQMDVMLVSDGELRNVLWRHLERASGGTDEH